MCSLSAQSGKPSRTAESTRGWWAGREVQYLMFSLFCAQEFLETVLVFQLVICPGIFLFTVYFCNFPQQILLCVSMYLLLTRATRVRVPVAECVLPDKVFQ